MTASTEITPLETPVDLQFDAVECRWTQLDDNLRVNPDLAVDAPAAIRLPAAFTELPHAVYAQVTRPISAHRSDDAPTRSRSLC
jgi:hypothetical protein